MARKVAAKHKIHKAVHKATRRKASTLAKAGAFLASPVPDVELLIAAMNPGPDAGIKFVLGIAKRAGKRASEVQSILFDKLKWTADAAKGWLKDHGFTGTAKDEGATFWRFRQQSPRKYKEFRTIVPSGRRNPAPDVADSIRSYDEHLGITTRPEFMEATPDEQAAAMTAMDMAENPRKGFWTLARSTQLSSTPPDKYDVVHGPYQLILSDTGAVEILKHGEGRGGKQRLLIKVDRYGTPHWGWVDKDQLYFVPEAHAESGEAAVENPKRNALGGSRGDFEYHPEDHDPATHAWVEKVFHAPAHQVIWIPAHSKVMRAVKVSPENYAFSVHNSPEDEQLPSFKSRRVRWASFKYQIAEEIDYFIRYGQLHPVSSRSYNPSSDLGQAAFDAGKDFRLSGAYSETGVANARVAKYGFTKWYNSLPLWGRGPRPTRTYTKARLLKNWMEGWAAGKRVEKRGNPEPDAVALFREFHGRDPETVKTVVSEEHEHEWMTELGPLEGLVVETMSGLKATINFEGEDMPSLASSEDGKQLFVVGDVELDLGKLRMAGPKWERDLMTIGTLTQFTYIARKDHIDKRKTSYFHNTAEAGGPTKPMLLYEPQNKRLLISGGNYKTTSRGVEN